MYIGLDIGGTKIESVVYDLQLKEVVARYRLPTPKDDYQTFLDSVSQAIDKVMADNKESQHAIGIGCCGSMNGPSGVMHGANLQILNGQDFIGDLKQRYPGFSIELANDADCFALSEFVAGAARAAQSSCAAIIMGTGFGSGLIINSGLVTGPNGLSGEIGHNPLPGFTEQKDGPATVCSCGGMNCVELFCSGTGFERTFRQKYGLAMTARDIFSFAETDKRAQAHIALFADQVARVLSNLINHIDPEVIVLGGGMSNEESIYPLISECIPKYTFNKEVQTPVVQSANGASSGVIGAALLPLFREQGVGFLKKELSAG